MRACKVGSSSRRGSTLVESAIVAAGFIVFMAGVMEFGRIGFAYNQVSFAAERAARFASVRGSGSGHAATATDVQNNALGYFSGIDRSQITVTTTWTPDNKPGSKVQVRVAYAFVSVMPVISKTGLALHCTARDIITQ